MLQWSRLTSSRLAVFYLLLAATHGVTQVALQITAFTVNTDAANLLNDIVTVGGAQSNNFTLYDPKTKTLKSCSGHGKHLDCVTTWQGGTDANNLARNDSIAYTSSNSTSSSTTASISATASSVSQPLASTSTSSNGTTTALSVTSTVTAPSSAMSATSSSSATPTAQTKGQVFVTQTVFVTVTGPTTVASEPTASLDLDRRSEHLQARLKFSLTDTNSSAPVSEATLDVQVSGLPNNPGVVDVSLECVSVLRWPLQTLRNTQREDVVFVLFQIWVLGMSVVAVLNESIPHTVAALLTHGLATMWAGFQLFDTGHFKQSFSTLVVDGACKGVSIFPTYWKLRHTIEVLILVMNAVVLVANAFLSWKVLKVFGWATFRRIGANRKISNVYKVVLVMATLLQLSLFFMLTSVALWIDQLHSGAIGRFSSHATIEIAVMSVMLLVPWLGLGWFSVRKESKKMMYGFFAISGIFVGEWASEFISSSWRLTFTTWAFFAIMSVVSMGLMIVVTVLGVCCLRNFGHGLPACLYGQEIQEHDDFERISPPTPDLEKSSLVDLLEENIAWPEETTDWRGSASSDQAVAMPLPAVVRSAHFPSIPQSQPPLGDRGHEDFQPPITTDLHHKSSLRSFGSADESEAENRDWFQDTQSNRSRSRWSQDEADNRKSKPMVIKRWAIQ